MPTIKRFEDLHAWQTARELTNLVYQYTHGEGFARDYGLRDQIRRAASSVMSNIAEGFDAGSDAEFVRFLGYARRSPSETQSQLYTAFDQKYIPEIKFNAAHEKAQIVKRQINALISYLSKSKTHTVKENSAPYTLDIEDDFTDHLDRSD
jgi:four helix bundle protein